MAQVERRWLQHYPEEVPHTIDYPRHNIAHFLIHTASKYPDHLALDFLGKKMKYSELLEASRRFAHAMVQCGIQQKERIAIMLPNCPQAIIAYYGALLMGAIVVQTNPLYTERELVHQLQDSGSVVILTLDILYRKVERVRPETSIRKVILTSIRDYLPFPKNWLYPIRAKKDGLRLDVEYSEIVIDLKSLLAESSADPILAQCDAENDLALLQYTGGTTGLAKGCMLTHFNLIANTLQCRAWIYRLREGESRYLAALPFFHVFGMTTLMNQSVYLGGQLLLVPKYQPSAILKLIHRKKPTVFPGAPTMYIGLIHQANISKYDLSSIEVCISGAAPLPAEVQDRFESITGGRLIEGYGLTEASPVTHANNIWGVRKKGSVGIPFPDTIAQVVDPETGNELPPGQPGELAVAGPQVMKGYWNKPEENAKVFKNGMLLTGDMATMDEDGYFYILDRKKDMIIAGGFNIYPREIEEVLYEHPDVKDAVVVGMPDPYRGETVKAFIVARDGAALDESELNTWCRERLAAYKVPRMYAFRKDLPKTMVGKVLRRKLIEEEQHESP